MEAAYVETIHDEIISTIGGLSGFAGSGRGGLEAALFRIKNHCDYSGLNDVFSIAALYAEALACGHVFNDGNKRTALTCALTYLAEQGINVPRERALEDAICCLAKREISREDFASILDIVWKGCQG